jgi:O-antigen ligase
MRNNFIISPFIYRLILFIVFMIAPVGVMAPHAMVLLIILGGICGGSVIYKYKIPFQLSKNLIISLFLLICWGILTSVWSKIPLKSFLLSLKLLSICVLGGFWFNLIKIVDERQRNGIAIALLTGIILALAFISLDAEAGHFWLNWKERDISGAFSHGALAIAVALWPCLCWLYQKSILGKIFLFLISFIVFFLLRNADCDTSIVALIIGCVVVILFSIKFFEEHIWFSLKSLIVISIFAAPIVSILVFTEGNIEKISSYTTKSSYIARLYIWNSVSKKTLEKPIIGHGLGSTPFLNPMKQTPTETKDFKYPYIAMHPHNIALQWWLELGVIGAILGTWLLLSSLSLIQNAKITFMSKNFFIGFFITSLGVFWVSTGAWQSWWLSSLWLIGSIMATLVQKVPSYDKQEAHLES